MRKRKRDWRLTVYRYWAEPVDLPVSVWTVAEAMRTLWNRLVTLYDDALWAEETLPEASAADIRAATDEAVVRLVKSSGLNWECGPEVLDRFRAARTRAFRARKRGAPPGRVGLPKIKDQLDSIAIPHRFTNGGADIQRLFSKRARGFTLASVDVSAYGSSRRCDIRRRATSGTFRVGDEVIKFRTVLHRPLPPAAVVKKVTWVGQRHQTRGWQWSIAITVEQPLPEKSTDDIRGCVALDIGWRVFEGYIRIGMLYDGARFYELRCPLDMPSYSSRRHQLPSSYYALIEYDRQIAALVEKTKSAVRSSLRAESRGVLVGACDPVTWERGRQGALMGLLKHFRSTENAPPALVAALEQWFAENERLRSLRAALYDRLTARRRWYYRNLAHWLASSYQLIGREVLDRPSEWKLKDSVDVHRLGAARRYRHWAALSELVRYVDEAALKSATGIIVIDPINTTRQCARCGELAEAGASLVITCPQGHRWDQDANAARNIFSRMQRDRIRMEACRRTLEKQSVQTPVIPDTLRTIVVEVLPE